MRKKKNVSMNSLIVGFSIAFIVVFALNIYQGQKFWQSDEVTATVTKDIDSYVTKRKTKKEIGRQKQRYFVVTVFQNMEVEYVLDGKAITKNTGFIEVKRLKKEIHSIIDDKTTDEEYIEGYAYDVGDKVELCITKNGEFYISDEVKDDNGFYQKLLIALGAALLLMILRKILKIKKNKSEQA